MILALEANSPSFSWAIPQATIASAEIAHGINRNNQSSESFAEFTDNSPRCPSDRGFILAAERKPLIQ
jgi:hypothetical protein